MTLPARVDVKRDGDATQAVVGRIGGVPRYGFDSVVVALRGPARTGRPAPNSYRGTSRCHHLLAATLGDRRGNNCQPLGHARRGHLGALLQRRPRVAVRPAGLDSAAGKAVVLVSRASSSELRPGSESGSQIGPDRSVGNTRNPPPRHSGGRPDQRGPTPSPPRQ